MSRELFSREMSSVYAGLFHDNNALTRVILQSCSFTLFVPLTNVINTSV